MKLRGTRHFSNLYVNLFSIQQPHQKQPQKNKADRIGERCVYRRRDGKKNVVEDPLLERYILPFLRAGDANHAEKPRHDPGENKKGESVYTEHNERPRPRPVTLDVDQPITESQRQERESRSVDDVGTCPERFVQGKQQTPRPSDGEKSGAEEEQAGNR